MTGTGVGLDVSIVEKSFAVLDASKGVADVGFADADRFDLASFQLDTGLVALEDVKIAQRLAIKDRLGGHFGTQAGRLRSDLLVIR
jgi:hypothetical protein